MLAWRLLGSYAGEPWPGDPVVFTFTAAPEGAWPTLGGSPFQYNGKTWVGYADNTGLIRVAEFTNATGVVTSTTVGTPGSPDQHDMPAIIRRSSDGKLVTVFCHHAAATIFVRVSTAAEDATSWGSATNIDPSILGTAYTYPWLGQLGDETDDPIYLFVRDQDGSGNNWITSKSTDGGVTWSVLTNLVFGERYYAKAYKTSESRIDFVVCNGSYAEDFASLAHFYYELGSYYKSDGTMIAGSPPFDFADFTLVYDGSTAGVRAPADLVNDGTNIAVVFPVQTGTPSGHLGEDEDYVYCRAAVGSATWTNETVATDVGGLTFEFTEGSLAIDPANINRLFVSRRETSDLGDPFHMYEYIRTGLNTFTQTQLTSTGDPDMYPWFVLNHTPELEVVWLKGTFTNQTTYDTGIEGYGA